jgi:tetratricopeptide (TPR) repeat protein
MTRIWRSLLCTLALPCITFAQTNTPPKIVPGKLPSPSQLHAPKTAPDYSHEPFVIEHYITTVRFENDGTGERDLSARIRVQTSAGADALKELVFGYRSPAEEINIRFVRVHKPGGTVANVATDPSTSVVKDVPIALAADAPAYASAKERHILVSSLQPGDILEYEIGTRITTPEAPGEFWFQQDFLDNAIVLDEELKIDLPQARAVVLKSTGFPYGTSQSGGRVVYSWKHTNLTNRADNDPTSPEALARAAKFPDVQLTSFANWQQLARWYANLGKDRANPTPEIRAKAQQLTAGRATDIEKIQALYDYISKSVRYVDIPLGLVGYQPHSAAEIFANQYADAKDEQVLLAAMLNAVGIPSDAALIPYVRKLDVSVPSPAQLDHVIVAVPQASDLLWMDSTAEVAPFRLLTSPLRDKSALVISADGAGKLAQTPQDPPFLSTQKVEIDGHVGDLGKLVATVHYSLRGDMEFVLRRAFHTTPEAQWKDLGETILSLDGVRGNVISVKPGDPLDTSGPFEIAIEFAEPNFLDWSAAKARFALPMLTPGMPDLPQKSTQPIAIGSPLDVTTQLKLVLPDRFTSQAPIGSSVSRDYAEFKSAYQFKDHTLTAARTLNFKMRALPASRAGDYQAFTRSVAADENQSLLVVNTEAARNGENAASASGSAASNAAEASSVVVPQNARPDELLEAGSASLDAGNPRSALPLFRRAVVLDPQHQQAWNDVGLAYMQLGDLDSAIAAFRKQIEIDPSNEHSFDYLGVALERQEKYDDAADAYRHQIALSPLDPVAHGALGGLLLNQRRYAEAIPELDKATVLSPENAGLEIKLGEAYLNSGDEKKSLDAFEKGISMAPAPAIWNSVAVQLADHKVALDRAQQYAESAVAAVDAKLQSADLSKPANEHVNDAATLGILWDTLGWVHFQKADINIAEKYIRASWQLDQRGESADHLAQIDQKSGAKDEAIHMFALSLAAPHPDSETRARLTLLLGGNSKIDELVAQANPVLEKLRTIPAGNFPKSSAGMAQQESAGAHDNTAPTATENTEANQVSSRSEHPNLQAEFLIVFSPAQTKAHVDAVQFVSGAASLRPLADRLRALDYGMLFPDATPIKIIRRGTLSCSASSAACSFTLAPAEDLRAAPEPSPN